MSDVSGIVTVNTPVVSVLNNLVEARRFKDAQGKEQGDPKYGSVLVFDKEHPNLNAIKEAAVAIAKAKWPGRDVGADYKAKLLKMPWRNGDDWIARNAAKLAKKGKEDDHKYDYMAGKVVLKSASKFRPRLSFIENGKITPDLDDAGIQRHKAKFYNGVEALVEINLVAFDAVKEGDADNITAYLNIFCSTNTGKRVGGGRSASEAFAGYAGKAKPEDPTKGDPDGLDDEIPF
jgi:hypothetical protein